MALQQKKKIFTNIVEESKMRDIQKRTLTILQRALTMSFGPYGSNTTIAKPASESELAPIKYTKDGHDILSAIKFQDVIEMSIRDNIQDITQSTDLKVGDCTTSAVILSSILFHKFVEDIRFKREMPYNIIKQFKSSVEKVKEQILTHKQEFSPEMAYDIAYISTNGNESVAKHISDIYKDHGNDVFIDVTISQTEKDTLRIYDGIVLESGLMEEAFVNRENGVCGIHNARVYAFEDPIDTPAIAGLFDAIVSKNIIEKLNNKQAPIPTVIMAPSISRDMSANLEEIVRYLAKIKMPFRPEFLIITHMDGTATYGDLMHLAGCKPIKKYIDPEQRAIDIEKGIAPTIETITDFYGEVEYVEADSFKTKFVNPKKMFTTNEAGERIFSETFNSQINFLENEIKKLGENQLDALERYRIKKRVQALKGAMVEYMVGGVTISDRESVRDLVKDAVKNCRSAATYGVGNGSNFEGYRAIKELIVNNEDDQFLKILEEVYEEIINLLYEVSGISKEDAKSILDKSIELGSAYNIRTEKHDGKVLSSIQSDIAVLESVTAIVSLMITTNQFICPDFMYNRYSEGE